MAMLRPNIACVYLLVVLSGCATPLSNSWDDPLYAKFMQEYSASDAEALLPEDSPWQMPLLSQLDTLNLENAIAIGLNNHPRLRTAVYEIHAAQAREIQAGIGPNPSVAYEAEGLGAAEGSGGESAYIVSQEFITAGKLEKAGLVAQAELFQSQAEFLATKSDFIADVKQAFYSVLAGEKRVEARQRLADVAGQLLASVNAQVVAGSAIEPDRLRANVASQQAKLELQDAESDLFIARRSLMVNLGLETPITLPVDGDLEAIAELPKRDVILQRVLARNSNLEAARLGIERARKAHDLAKAESWPNITAFAGPRYSDIDGESTMDAGIEMEIPLFDRNQGGIAEALAERLKAGTILGQTKLDLIEATSEAWSQYKTSRDAAKQYREVLLPMSRRTLDLTEQGYKSGKFGYLRLLDAQQLFVQTNIVYVDNLLRLQQAIALLEALMQSELNEFNTDDTSIKDDNDQEVSP